MKKAQKVKIENLSKEIKSLIQELENHFSTVEIDFDRSNSEVFHLFLHELIQCEVLIASRIIKASVIPSNVARLTPTNFKLLNTLI